jgi:hypothetical protein
MLGKALIAAAVAIVGGTIWFAARSDDEPTFTVADVEALVQGGDAEVSCAMETPSHDGVGIWKCTPDDEQSADGREIRIVVGPEGSYQSRSVGIPAVGGCCLGD